MTQQNLLIPSQNDDVEDIEKQYFEPDDCCPTGFNTGGFKAELTIKQKDSPKKIKLNHSRDWFEPGAIDKKDALNDSYSIVSPTLQIEEELLPQR